MTSPDDDIYEPGFVGRLFDDMSASYGMTNLVSSFGFCRRWRRQTVEGISLRPDQTIVDMMTGMGECWRFLSRPVAGDVRIIGIDISADMCRRARRQLSAVAARSIEVRHVDALDSGLSAATADAVVASFGLKTFSPTQTVVLSRELWRLLKPGGAFSFVEISLPSSPLLRWPFVFYLRYVIPLIGRLMLGNPDNYRMLAIYTERFGEGAHVVQALTQQGFRVRSEPLFFGCARRIAGTKPA
ncbi:MAG: class I SAM-dependent methyltransferase [Gemmatimonadaceae bacterium]